MRLRPRPSETERDKGGDDNLQTSQDPASDRGGHALRAPSPLHAFNRYEIKYLVHTSRLAALRDQLRSRLDQDSYCPEGGYGVWSVYYDTRQLRFYWEKIEGLRFRRKLRIRHYGDRFNISDDTTVYVEIKQRVNRVTQKRRVGLSYSEARRLCDSRQMVEHQPGQTGFVQEVLGLVNGFDLRAVAMTGYQREAYVGRGAEIGLRVTVDHRVRGRDRDFDLGSGAENRLIIPASMSVLEVKANDRVPYWLTDLAAHADLSVVRMSKYCQGVEAFGKAPRSIFHIPDHDGTDSSISPDTAEAPASATSMKA